MEPLNILRTCSIAKTGMRPLGTPSPSIPLGYAQYRDGESSRRKSTLRSFSSDCHLASNCQRISQYEESLINGSADIDALQHAITAVELYMKASKEAKDSKQRRRLSRKCIELLNIAEEIKRRQTRLPQGVHHTRSIPIKEQNILLRSSRLNGCIFPPWESDPDSSLFRLDDSGLFVYADLRLPPNPQDLYCFSPLIEIRPNIPCLNYNRRTCLDGDVRKTCLRIAGNIIPKPS
jgi:hypothetical protein